ncbi:MAG: tetratricopeptide repeat protein, partial [Promethearchaeota archaeon]
LNGIGQIYYQQGKLDLAIENIEKSLPFFETINIPLFLLEVGWRYDTLIKIELDKKSIDQAQKNLRRYLEWVFIIKSTDNAKEHSNSRESRS